MSIQGILGRETGLALPTSRTDNESPEPATHVSADIKPGAYPVYEDVELDGEYGFLTQIMYYHDSLKRFVESGKAIAPLFEDLSRNTQSGSLLKGRHTSLAPAIPLAQDLLSRLENRNPLPELLQIEADILGHYSYDASEPTLFGDYTDARQGRIALYWGIIGFAALWSRVSVGAKTVIVLAHELAHAFTYLGADKDGRWWGSNDFAGSQAALVEGIAQYYTHVACKELDGRIPGVFAAYEDMLRRQSEVYRRHLSWVKEFSKEEVSEAFVEIRRQHKVKVAEFELALTQARPRLRASGSPAASAAVTS